MEPVPLHMGLECRVIALMHLITISSHNYTVKDYQEEYSKYPHAQRQLCQVFEEARLET